MADKYKNIPAHTGWFFTSTTYHDAPPELDPTKVRLPNPCVVCITGGGRGLGEAYAVAFAQAGASDVILSARSVNELETVASKLRNISKNVRVSTVSCDVTSEADVENLANVIRKDHGGRLDVLIVSDSISSDLCRGFGFSDLVCSQSLNLGRKAASHFRLATCLFASLFLTVHFFGPD